MQILRTLDPSHCIINSPNCFTVKVFQKINMTLKYKSLNLPSKKKRGSYLQHNVYENLCPNCGAGNPFSYERRDRSNLNNQEQQ